MYFPYRKYIYTENVGLFLAVFSWLSMLPTTGTHEQLNICGQRTILKCLNVRLLHGKQLQCPEKTALVELGRKFHICSTCGVSFLLIVLQTVYFCSPCFFNFIDVFDCELSKECFFTCFALCILIVSNIL